MEVTDTQIAHTFLDQLQASASPLRAELVARAQQALDTTQVPTTRTEAWKYTRIARLTRKQYTQTSPAVSTVPRIVADSKRIVFVNGLYVAALSDTNFPEGVTVKSLRNCTTEELKSAGEHVVLENELFNAINTVYAQDGAYVHIQAGVTVESVIEVVHYISGNETMANLRNLFIVGSSANVKMVQSFFSANATDSFCNSLTEIAVSRNATIVLDKVQNEDSESNQIATEYVHQEADSNFTINTLTLNGSLVRNNLNIAVDGQNCETNLNGAYILNGKQHVDNHTIVDHKVAHCQSNELYKGVMDEKSTAVFNGKVFVRKDAQKINAFQSNGNVLLSDDATVNSKPELEIYADDVKCSHGSTTGQLDEEAVFYLRARGLSEKSARQLMVSAFVGDVLEKIKNEAVLDYVHQVLEARFGWIA